MENDYIVRSQSTTNGQIPYLSDITELNTIRLSCIQLEMAQPAPLGILDLRLRYLGSQHKAKR